MKLNVGCANVKMEGYIGIDSRKTNATDRVLDALELVNHFPHGKVNEIYCGHMIEHLDKAGGIQLIKDFYTLLKPGGLLRLDLPLVDYLINNCWKGRDPEVQFINILYGIQRYPEDHHRYGYTRMTIEQLLNEHGFKIIDEKMGRLQKPHSKNGIMLWCRKIV